MRFPLSRSHLAFAHDTLMAAVSFVVSMALRLGWDQILGEPHILRGTLIFTGIAIPVLLGMRLYRGLWYYASISDLIAITKASTLIVLLFLPVMFLATRLESVPRSFLVINWFVLLTLLGGPRLLYRRFRDRHAGRRVTLLGQRRIPVLLVGAGDGADLFIRAMTRSAEFPYEVVGLVSIHAERVGSNIHGFTVMGCADDIPAVVERLNAQGKRPHRLIVAEPNSDGALVRRLLDTATSLGMSLARVPKLTDFRAGAVDKLEVRPIAVEDLLGRPQAVLDRDGLRALISGKDVLVTGAGGSIGSELVRQIAELAPRHLTLLDSCEFALYTIDAEVSQRWAEIPHTARLASVRDRQRMNAVFAESHPQLVFHAAALKHVPMVEDNPVEGVLTNVIGSRIVADCCVAHQVETMVMISTDKAVNPANVMGATKRVAESYCQAMDVAQAQPRLVTVRFGNVLGSTGSVVPLFQRQLEAGGPITVTDAEMVRYFMTIREAVELVLQAAVLDGSHHETGKIYVLDMGEPVKIVDLARQMIRLAGLRPDEDIAITFTGVRPGEKLFEEIFHGEEAPVPTARDGLLLASPRLMDLKSLQVELDHLETLCISEQTILVLQALRDFVPEYTPDRGVLASAESPPT